LSKSPIDSENGTVRSYSANAANNPEEIDQLKGKLRVKYKYNNLNLQELHQK